MSGFAIVAHRYRSDAGALAGQIAARLGDAGHDVWMSPADADAVGVPELAGERPFADADLVVCLGGDGTMLHAVHELGGADVPLLGVNLGRLGYLTEVEVDEVDDALARFERGSTDGGWWLDRRMMLDIAADTADGERLGPWRALNEAVVEKQSSGHTVHLQLGIDGEPFTSYATDGLIVSTPTGSTAYSLSARGPVVSPRHRALLVTPVAPHMLFDRSLVLDPSERVEIEVIGDRDAALAVDGRNVGRLAPGATVRCAPSEAVASFVRFADRPYHQVLKAKFGLQDR